MPRFFTYLVSSLPMLHFAMKPPFTFEGFLGRCKGLVPDEDLALLENLPRPQDYGKVNFTCALLEEWVAFDTALRNEMAKIRAARKHLDASLHIRSGPDTGLSLAHQAMNIHRIPSLIDAEVSFDQLRWKALDDLSIGHFFDLESLIVYAYKLLILLRWEKINRSDKAQILKETIDFN